MNGLCCRCRYWRTCERLMTFRFEVNYAHRGTISTEAFEINCKCVQSNQMLCHNKPIYGGICAIVIELASSHTVAMVLPVAGPFFLRMTIFSVILNWNVFWLNYLIVLITQLTAACRWQLFVAQFTDLRRLFAMKLLHDKSIAFTQQLLQWVTRFLFSHKIVNHKIRNEESHTHTESVSHESVLFCFYIFAVQRDERLLRPKRATYKTALCLSLVCLRN